MRERAEQGRDMNERAKEALGGQRRSSVWTSEADGNRRRKRADTKSSRVGRGCCAAG